MLNNIFIFAVALFMVIKGATLSTKYSGRLAESFRLSKYVVGFIIVAVISVLPEMFIAINAAMKGMPSFGLGVLFGSNVADMTLVMAGIVFFAGRSLKVESKIMKSDSTYPFVLLLPLILGLDGYFSRIDGLALVLAGVVFYYIALKNGGDASAPTVKASGRYKNSLMLLLGMAVLLVGSHFVVTSVSSIAFILGVSPILIGMLVVGIGTTMPEFLFSVNAVKAQNDSLAVGDILGTVLADATVIVGILALINPFSFPQKIIYVTGAFMVTASFLLFRFMRSGRRLTKKETYFLVAFWLVFVFVELMVNK